MVQSTAVRRSTLRVSRSISDLSRAEKLFSTVSASNFERE
jgi:hypothetical protein